MKCEKCNDIQRNETKWKKTKYAAIALAGFCIFSAVLFHADFSNQAEMTNFMKNIAIAGGFLTLFIHGAGAFSLDNRANKKAI